MAQPSSAQTVYPMLVNCVFTIDNIVDAVWYNGVNITDRVQPQSLLHVWETPKTISFVEEGDAGGYLEFMGHNWDDEGDGCQHAGLLWYCTGGVEWNGCVSQT
jgi:hypothetical protein